MRHLSLLIFDLDNTIYDWYSAFLPAFYEMVSVAAGDLKCERETLLDELQQVHIRHHDVEHPFSLAETSTVRHMMQIRGEDKVWALLDPAFHAFNATRKANLKLFPGTMKALNAFLERQIRLVAYTDSTYYAARGRIERLGLSDVFEKIYCREKGQSIVPQRYAKASPSAITDKVVQIPSHESKPNPRVLGDIVCAHNQRISEVGYVGDSLAKDVLMAKRAGCFAVWAKYGAHTDRAMYERLIRISHWTPDDIQREKNHAIEAKDIQPDFICEHSLEELVAFVADEAALHTAGHERYSAGRSPPMS
jgi:phosphoglycolate phosphatase